MLSCSRDFHGSFLDSLATFQCCRQAESWRLHLIKYVHHSPFDDFDHFEISFLWNHFEIFNTMLCKTKDNIFRDLFQTHYAHFLPEYFRKKSQSWKLHIIRYMYDGSFNSLGPSDAIWRQRSGSTLAQVMACCLTAPSHNLNQC